MESLIIGYYTKKTAPLSPSLDLSSRYLAKQVLSALTRFTSEFGMGSGGSTSLKRLEDTGAVKPQCHIFTC